MLFNFHGVVGRVVHCAIYLRFVNIELLFSRNWCVFFVYFVSENRTERLVPNYFFFQNWRLFIDGTLHSKVQRSIPIYTKLLLRQNWFVYFLYILRSKNAVGRSINVELSFLKVDVYFLYLRFVFVKEENHLFCKSQET